MTKLLARLKEKIPAEVRFVALMFLGTRLALTLIGVISRMILHPAGRKQFLFQYHQKLWLDIWSVWDSGWYLDIATRGYSLVLPAEPLPRFVRAGQANYAFFPLYPKLMGFIGTVIGSPYVAGILISNIALIVAGVLLYRLARLREEHDTAINSTKYLFLFPTAFVLSGIFTESLFLALFIACFYYARRGKWLVAGVTGLGLALTRTIGVIAIVPLLYEYLRSREFRFRNIRPDILYLALLPCGTLIYACYCRYLTGDFLAFSTVQKAWDRQPVNPLKVLVEGFGAEELHVVFAAVFVTVCLLILIIFCRKLGLAYWLVGMYSILIPLSNSPDVSQMGSLARYSLVIFPFYLLFGRLSRYPTLDKALTAFLALLQGFLMVFWCNGAMLVV